MFLCFCNLGLFYFKVPIRGVVPGEGSLSGWAFKQLPAASIRVCCQDWREVEASSPRLPRQFSHISRNLLSAGLWLRDSGGERRDGGKKQCRGIAKELLWILYFPIPYNQDFTAALIVIAHCYCLAPDSGCQTIISCPGQKEKLFQMLLPGSYTKYQYISGHHSTPWMLFMSVSHERIFRSFLILINWE